MIFIRRVTVGLQKPGEGEYCWSIWLAGYVFNRHYTLGMYLPRFDFSSFKTVR